MIRKIHFLPVCALLLATNGSGLCDKTEVAQPEPAFRTLHDSLRRAAAEDRLPARILARADSLEARHTERLRIENDQLQRLRASLLEEGSRNELLDELIAAVIERERLRHAGIDSLRSLAGLLGNMNTLYDKETESGLQLRWEPEDLSGSVEDP